MIDFLYNVISNLSLCEVSEHDENLQFSYYHDAKQIASNLKIMMRYLDIISIVFAVTFFPKALSDMLPSPFPYDVIESDGNIVEGVTIKGTSNEFWEEDASGYTIIDDQYGHKVYATNDSISGNIKPTDTRANGSVNPSKLGSPKHINPNFKAALSHGGDIKEGVRRLRRHRERSISSATVKNLVIPIRFSDHKNRQLPSTADLDIFFNSQTTDEIIAPTGSVRKVFETSSFGELDLVSSVLPIISLSSTESYYANGSRGFSSKFWEAIREALHYADVNGLVNFDDFDDDNDGQIDAITFLHSGYGAEWGGSDCSKPSASTYNRIWSHKWAISPAWQSYNEIKVSRYHVSPLLWGTCGDAIGRIGVISHEIGHLFGLPDLYDTSGGGSGIGSFGLMANSWGFDNSQRYPPIMSPWSKNELGWLNCPVIDSSGTYTLKRSSQYNECFKIMHGFPSGEYLYIENRNKYSFDTDMPQDGLVIWHIDESGNHDKASHPYSNDWPATKYHYINTVLQADGRYYLEQGSNKGDAGDVFHGGSGGIKQILPSTNILTGPFPNTDSYQGGNMVKTNIKITNISPPGQWMTFDLKLVDKSSNVFPTTKITNYPTLAPGIPARLCLRNCNKRKANWKLKCSKHRNKCGGCDKCQTISLRCRRKCQTSKEKWKKKCGEPKKCAGCPQCASK